MKHVWKSWAPLALALAQGLSLPALAQRIPGEIPRPDTYEGSKALQEQQQRNAEAARKSAQDQSNAFNQQFDQNMNASRARQQQSLQQGQAQGAQLEAARQAWQKKPALPPDKNPLIGARWTRPPTAQSKSNDPFAGMAALMKGGLCEVLFGGGTFEFRPNALVGFDAHTPPQELDKVEYRGDAKHVVIIPKATVRLMEFDVETPDRIRWPAYNCVLVRAGRTAAR